MLHVTRKASEALPASWYQSAKGATDATPIRVSHVVTGDGAKAEVAGEQHGVQMCAVIPIFLNGHCNFFIQS